MKSLYGYMRKTQINQNELAASLGTDKYTVSRWLNGAQVPGLDSLQSISDLTGILLTELIAETRRDRRRRKGTKSNGSR